MKPLVQSDYSSIKEGDFLQLSYQQNNVHHLEFFRILKCMYELDFVLIISPCDSSGICPVNTGVQAFSELEFWALLNESNKFNGQLSLLEKPSIEAQRMKCDSFEFFQQLKHDYKETLEEAVSPRLEETINDFLDTLLNKKNDSTN